MPQDFMHGRFLPSGYRAWCALPIPGALPPTPAPVTTRSSAVSHFRQQKSSSPKFATYHPIYLLPSQPNSQSSLCVCFRLFKVSPRNRKPSVSPHPARGDIKASPLSISDSTASCLSLACFSAPTPNVRVTQGTAFVVDTQAPGDLNLTRGFKHHPYCSLVPSGSDPCPCPRCPHSCSASSCAVGPQLSTRPVLFHSLPSTHLLFTGPHPATPAPLPSQLSSEHRESKDLPVLSSAVPLAPAQCPGHHGCSINVGQLSKICD